MPINPNNLGNKVTTRSVSFLDLATRAWGAEWSAPDHGAYVFGKRQFDSTDRGRTGIYGVAGDNLLLIDGSQYPDMRDAIIASVGIQPGSANDGYGSYQEIDSDPRY